MTRIRQHMRHSASGTSMMEQLENRRLLSGGLPALSISVSYKGHTILPPGSKATLPITISNSGGDLTKTTVPVNVYFESTPTIPDGATPFLTLDPVLTIKSGSSKTESLHGTVPASAPSGFFYVIASLGTNGLVTGTDSAATGQLNNPVGSYAGTSTLTSVGGSTNPFSIEVSSNGKSLLSTLVFDNGSGAIQPTGAKTVLSSTGKLTISSSGTANDDGNPEKYSLKLIGQLSGDAITGTMMIKATEGHSTGTVDETFTVSRATF